MCVSCGYWAKCLRQGEIVHITTPPWHTSLLFGMTERYFFQHCILVTIQQPYAIKLCLVELTADQYRKVLFTKKASLWSLEILSVVERRVNLAIPCLFMLEGPSLRISPAFERALWKEGNSIFVKWGEGSLREERRREKALSVCVRYERCHEIIEKKGERSLVMYEYSCVRARTEVDHHGWVSSKVSRVGKRT